MGGTFEAMWTGEVDYNWTKEHHDLWLEEELTTVQPARQQHVPSAIPAE
jgi:formate dehydrogenase subunit gamma